MSNSQNRYQGSVSYEQVDLSEITFAKPQSNLFDSVAENTAKCVAESATGFKKNKNPRDVNKSTQLRKFYDEVVMWEQRVRQKPDAYDEYLPMIKMINAKVAYAHGRELVDKNFVDVIRHCLNQLETGKPELFKNFRLFMEAFMGFYKMHKND